MTRDMSDYNHAHIQMSHDQKSHSLAANARMGMTNAGTRNSNRLN